MPSTAHATGSNAMHCRRMAADIGVRQWLHHRMAVRPKGLEPWRYADCTDLLSAADRRRRRFGRDFILMYQRSFLDRRRILHGWSAFGRDLDDHRQAPSWH